jgi:hypothetical protein
VEARQQDDLLEEDKETLFKLKQLNTTRPKFDKYFGHNISRRSFITLGQIAFAYIEKQTECKIPYIHDVAEKEEPKTVQIFHEEVLWQDILNAVNKGLLQEVIFELIISGKQMIEWPDNELYDRDYITEKAAKHKKWRSRSTTPNRLDINTKAPKPTIPQNTSPFLKKEKPKVTPTEWNNPALAEFYATDTYKNDEGKIMLNDPVYTSEISEESMKKYLSFKDDNESLQPEK